MSTKTKWILVAFAALIVIGVAGRVLLGDRPAGDTPHAFDAGETAAVGEGAMAPDFSFPSVPGGTTIRLSDYKGKVVLVNFWATWCPPCRDEIPDFVKVRDSLHAQGFEIIGISLDQGGPSVVVPFAREYGITYPLVIGDQQVTRRYGGIRGIPESFLVDREGRIVQKYIGPIDAQTLEYAVKTLL